jgi:hypothetical protein
MTMRVEWFRTKTVEQGIVLRAALNESLFIEYQPGNGTRYPLLITPIHDFPTEARSRMGAGREPPTGRELMVTLFRDEYRTVLVGGFFLAPSYLQEKLGVGEVDAVIIGELLGHLYGVPAKTVEQHVAWKNSLLDENSPEAA